MKLSIRHISKQALIQVPQNLANDIIKWLNSQYVILLKRYIENEPKLYSNDLKEMINKITDLTKFEKYKKFNTIINLYGINKSAYVDVEITGDTSYSGEYSPKLNRIYISFNTSLFDIKNIQDYGIVQDLIKGTVYHELRHFIQWFISDVKNLEEIIGLPPRKIRKRDFTEEEILRNEANPPQNKTEYALYDPEFHTILADQIFVFLNMLSMVKYKNSDLPDMIRTWVGIIPSKTFDFIKDGEHEQWELEPREFFSILKTHSPKKWKVAAKYFVSKVL